MRKIKNLLLLALLSVLRPIFFRTFKVDKNALRILVISTTGLGDTLWGMPSLRQLREKYPSAYIGILTSPIGKQLLINCPYVDTIIVATNPIFPSFFKLLRRLRKERFQKGYVFHISQRPILPLCALAGIAQLIGTKGINKGLDSLLTTAHPSLYEHEILRRIRLIDGNPKDNQMELFLSDNEKVFNQNTLIGLHPGAKDRFKMWDKRHFINVGKTLARALDAQIVVTGNAEEKSLADSIASEIPGAVSIAGKTSLRKCIALMEHFCLFITNDTGPMHIAFALRIPTIALFCVTDPNLCGPLDVENVEVISKGKTCSPCLKKQCRNPFCFEQITEAEVIEKALINSRRLCLTI